MCVRLLQRRDCGRVYNVVVAATEKVECNEINMKRIKRCSLKFMKILVLFAIA